MRDTIKQDLIFFALPAIVVLFAGLVVSAQDGYDGLTEALIDLIRHPRNLSLLSVQNGVGLVLFLVGMTVAVTAVVTLGRSYSGTLMTRRDQKLITHGIYRFVRHPVYLGVLTVVCLGVPVYASSVRGFLVLLILVPVFLNRIRMEERMLTGKFGDDYRSYKETTRKLVPFLY